MFATIHQASYILLGKFASVSEGGLHPKHRLTNYHGFFLDNIKEGDTVLDVGCGNGALLKDIILKTKALAVGVEISEANAMAARQNLYGISDVEIVCADIREYSMTRSFDVILLSNVLEHLEERPALLKSLKEKFRPRKILIRVPMFDREWPVPYKKELGVEWRLDRDHKVEYTEKLLRQELSEAGLEACGMVFRWGEMWAVVLSAR